MTRSRTDLVAPVVLAAAFGAFTSAFDTGVTRMIEMSDAISGGISDTLGLSPDVTGDATQARSTAGPDVGSASQSF